MAKSKGPKVYAVAIGRVPGVYNYWVECQKQVSKLAHVKSFLIFVYLLKFYML